MANILKANDSAPRPQRHVATGLAGFNLDDLSRRAKQQLDECQLEIARLREAAESEAETLRTQAHQQGLADGRRQAAEESEAKIRQAVDARIGEHGLAIRSMVEQIGKEHQDWMQGYADALVSTVIAVSERVIRGRLEREREIIARWAEDSLRASRSADRLTVAVHPETLAELGQTLDELLGQPGLPEETSIIPDESVPRDGVIVRQVGGEVVATLQSQLDSLRGLLEDV